MPKPRTLKLHGRDVQVVPIPIVNDQEHWNSYILEDGSLVRAKLIALDEPTVGVDAEPVLV